MHLNQTRIKMKKTIYLVTLLCLLIATPTFAQEIDLMQRKADLIGYWEIEEGRYLVIKENNEIALENEGEITKTGAWKLSDDGETFYILENDDIVEEMPIVEVSTTEFRFKTGNSEMALQRREAGIAQAPLTEEEIAERKKLIVGEWNVIELDENVEMSSENIKAPGIKVIFEASGKVIIFDGDRQKEATAWKLSEDGLYLIIIQSNEDEQKEEQAKIISIDEQSIVVLDNRNKIKFVRQ